MHEHRIRILMSCLKSQGIVAAVTRFHLIRQILTVHQISNQLLRLIVKMIVWRMMLLALLMRYEVLSQCMAEVPRIFIPNAKSWQRARRP
jgi:hypothetical protein